PRGPPPVCPVPPAGGDPPPRLDLVRLTPEGDVIRTTTFEELPGPRENLFYDESGVHELPVNVPFTLGFTSHVVGVAHGEGLYLLAEWTYAFKLYSLDAAYRRIWGAQVMPANIGTAFQSSPSI